MFTIDQAHRALPAVLFALLLAGIALLAPILQQGPAAGLPAEWLRAGIVALAAALLLDWLAASPLHALLLGLARPDEGWFEVHP